MTDALPLEPGKRRIAGRPITGRLNPPCLALFGEFSTGKSSVANLLLGTDMLPTSVLSSTRLPTRLRYADTLGIAAVGERGAHQMLDLDQLKTLRWHEMREVAIGVPSTLLLEVELLDMPGFADPYHDAEFALQAATQADLAIWCTLATQAWRQSEQQTWSSLPSRLRSTGLLVVTHCDALRSENDGRQLLTRLRHQAGPYFRGIVLLATRDAAHACDADAGVIDDALWESSGGSDLVTQIRGSLAIATALRRHRAWLAAIRPSLASEREDQAGARRTRLEAPSSAPAGHNRHEAPKTPGSLLARTMEAMPGCMLAASVDVAAPDLLAVRSAPSVPQALRRNLVAMSANLLRGKAVEAVSQMVLADRGGRRSDQDGYRETTVTTRNAVYVMLCRVSRPDRAVLLAIDRHVNISLALVKARRMLAKLERPGGHRLEPERPAVGSA